MITDKDIITTDQPKILSNGTVVNRFSHIVKGATIGENVMIGSFCYVSSKAIIGNNTRVQNHVNIYDGVEIGENVFIAPHVVFTNCHNPQDMFSRKGDFIPDITKVHDNATVCANTTIIAPTNIYKEAIIGAGSVVLRDIDRREKVYGVVK